jgi:hypothetical protein
MAKQENHPDNHPCKGLSITPGVITANAFFRMMELEAARVNGGGASGTRVCRWPERLSLNVRYMKNSS